MSKILYPVGTKVVLSEYADRDHKNLTPLYVVEYRKGKKFPYGVSKTEGGSPETLNGHKWRSVKGLKRYNPKELRSADSVDVSPTQAKVAEASPTASAPMNHNCYTKEEVDVLLAHQWQDILEVLSDVDRVAVEALRNTHMIADMTDSNFRKVAKQFKSLNHDDD